MPAKICSGRRSGSVEMTDGSSSVLLSVSVSSVMEGRQRHSRMWSDDGQPESGQGLAIHCENPMLILALGELRHHVPQCGRAARVRSPEGLLPLAPSSAGQGSPRQDGIDLVLCITELAGCNPWRTRSDSIRPKTSFSLLGKGLGQGDVIANFLEARPIRLE